jgi:hypothetical protein
VPKRETVISKPFQQYYFLFCFSKTLLILKSVQTFINMLRACTFVSCSEWRRRDRSVRLRRKLVMRIPDVKVVEGARERKRLVAGNSTKPIALVCSPCVLQIPTSPTPDTFLPREVKPPAYRSLHCIRNLTKN